VALPKFIAAQRDARIAKAQGIYGAIRSAAVLGKARCELDLAQGLVTAGTCGNAAPQVNMDGTNVAITNRYPAASAAGIQAAAGIDPTNDGLTITAGNPITFDVVGATTPATCRISYTAATAAAAPVITLTSTAGC
jgi:MSHA pilin protein MshA